jgi:hypothetical protein
MTRDRAHFAVVVTCGVAAFAACSPAVRSDRDESIPVPQGATWAWETAGGTRQPYEPAAPDSGAERPRTMMEPRSAMDGYDRDIREGDVIFAQRFRRAAEVVMQAKGFHKVDDASSADFLLTFDMGETRVRRGGMPGYGPWGSYRGAPRDTRLVVMLKQRERGDVAWRASYVMDIYDMRESSQAIAQKIANKVLRELR